MDETCSCHRSKANYVALALHDRTFRKGDAVMTPTGVVVYEGDNSGSPRVEDFIAVARERSLAIAVREYLSNLQSAPTVFGQAFGYPVAASTSVRSPAVEKAKVWVDSPALSAQ